MHLDVAHSNIVNNKKKNMKYLTVVFATAVVATNWLQALGAHTGNTNRIHGPISNGNVLNVSYNIFYSHERCLRSLSALTGSPQHAVYSHPDSSIPNFCIYLKRTFKFQKGYNTIILGVNILIRPIFITSN